MLSYIPKAVAVIIYYIRQTWIHYRLRRRGIQLASTTMIKGKCQISGKIEIGPDTIIQGASLDGRGGIIIGRNVILDQASIITAQHNLDSPVYETTYGTVIIEDYAILYQGALVLPGRRIGRGAVVAARAVVTRDVPDMAIVAGNPARVIRYRQGIHTECDLQQMGGFILGLRLRAWADHRCLKSSKVVARKI